MILDLIATIIVLYCIIQFIRLITGDADLQVQWYERFGKRPACLNGKIIWLVGASSGIGEALAYDLARAGCRLILSARREDQLNRVKDTCVSEKWLRNDDIYVLPLDVCDVDSHQKKAELARSKFGKIDILILNSGLGHIAKVIDTELEVVKQVMAINFFGFVSLSKLVLPDMINRRNGHIVVNSSLAGKYGMPPMSAYNAAKHAIQGWFDTLRLEESHNNIKVTVVCPGPVSTEIFKSVATGKVGERFDATNINKVEMMSAERCSELIAVAIANNLDEAWISQQPELFIAYMAQYTPNFSKFIGRKFLAPTMLKNLDKVIERAKP